MKTLDPIRMLQFLLQQTGHYHAKLDGLWGEGTELAYTDFREEFGPAPHAGAPPGEPEGDLQWHSVQASSFADPADIRAFKRCKKTGQSDQECFKVGDNGIGCWGDDTTTATPMCALPREDWQERWGKGNDGRGRRVWVGANKQWQLCELRDTMPRRANIKNGAGIDLNPAACAALGLKPPVMAPAVWAWADGPQTIA